MAATIIPQSTAKVLTFTKRCESVKRTDRKNRLPKLTSEEIDSIFDQVGNINEPTRRRAA